jgi:hypothetical protein
MQETMTSDRGHRYSIRVHQPQGQAPEEGHALVWLLDAPTTWAPMQQALNEAGDSGVVVIGLDWEDDGEVDQNLRRRDFTRPARGDVAPPRGRTEAWTLDGDGQSFMRFLCETLQPHYLATLPVDARRQTLVGHSLSGLFVLQALISRPQRFGAYVAASPSIWWDGARMMEEAGDLDWNGARGARVLISVGSHEQLAGPEKPPEVAGNENAAVFAEPHMVSNASAFSELVQARGIDCQFHLFEGQAHHAVLPEAMAAALEFARAPVEN